MEKPKPRRRTTKATANLCLPRLRPPTTTRPCCRLSPAMSLLDRLRKAVLRLIMLSAALSTSKATTQPKNTRSISGGDHCGNKYYCYNTNISYQQEPHHSEAFADCIEFIKKSAATTDESRDSTASARGSAGEEVVPVPVM
ncbi:Steroid receptor seven-up, A like [Actinidia chinensis var. chinensis]|uniref:Steroid receptor seven-up, A like n=1 Tax=Actinidia chinensis var. chinensis TaxID=1590841 RepID=A0A2R6S2R7_ACTCC|nr:Steroid receptor seven-up, A like [Actinidia chinensis var. chinensis]